MRQIKVFEELHGLPVNSIVWWKPNGPSSEVKLEENGVAMVIDESIYRGPWCIVKKERRGLGNKRVFCRFYKGCRSSTVVNISENDISKYDLRLLSPQDIIKYREDLLKIFFPQILKNEFKKNLISVILQPKL